MYNITIYMNHVDLKEDKIYVRVKLRGPFEHVLSTVWMCLIAIITQETVRDIVTHGKHIIL